MSRVYDTLWRVRRHTGRSDVACLRRLVAGSDVDTARVRTLLLELAGSPELAEALRTDDARRWFDGPGDLASQLALEGHGRGRAILLYAALRLAKPEVVVETGCFTGWDSALILQALDRNGRGRLTTIDLPAQEGVFSQLPGRRSGLLPGLRPGFLVPESLRSRWTLVVGDVRDELPRVLAKSGPVGAFFHDSDHTYAHMIWEYATVWPRLAPGALLVSDDVSWNASFWDFSRAARARAVTHRRTPNVAAARIDPVRVGSDPRQLPVRRQVAA